jgi:hypothetical protein
MAVLIYVYCVLDSNIHMDNTVFIPDAKILGFDSGNKIFCFSPKFLTASVAHPASYSGGTVSHLSRVNWRERVKEHLFPSSAQSLKV